MLPAFGLYTHIRANRRRSALLIAGLFVLVLVLTYGGSLVWRGWWFGLPKNPGPAHLQAFLEAAARDTLLLSPVVIAATAAWVFVSTRFHQALIDAVTGATEIERSADPRLYSMLENLCISRGLVTPHLGIIETPAINAFASGMRQGQYRVTVTRGLLDALDDEELEAVLAHELTHIRNEDVRLMVVAGVVAGVISFFGELVFRWLDVGRIRSSGDGDRKKGSGAMPAILIGLALIAVAWGLSLVIRFALSRRREYLADAGAVELTKNPDAMISALLKIEGKGELPATPSGIMEMCVDNPRSGFADLFATHPSIADRVAALERYAGGHRPATPFLPPGVEAMLSRSGSAETRAPSTPWGPAPQA
ncbi:MAG TPA: M48 family metallopeptidase [Beijerinckiaceae bacterium]